MTPTKIDLLLNCKWIIPIVPENQTLADCAIAIDNGKLLAFSPKRRLHENSPPEKSKI